MTLVNMAPQTCVQCQISSQKHWHVWSILSSIALICYAVSACECESFDLLTLFTYKLSYNVIKATISAAELHINVNFVAFFNVNVANTIVYTIHCWCVCAINRNKEIQLMRMLIPEFGRFVVAHKKWASKKTKPTLARHFRSKLSPIVLWATLNYIKGYQFASECECFCSSNIY